LLYYKCKSKKLLQKKNKRIENQVIEMEDLKSKSSRELLNELYAIAQPKRAADIAPEIEINGVTWKKMYYVSDIVGTDQHWYESANGITIKFDSLTLLAFSAGSNNERH